MASQNDEWNVVSMLNWATEYFEKKNIESPRLSIEWILSDILEIKRLDLYMQFDRPLTADELAAIKPLVKRRAAHEPLQYITGSAEFFNVTLTVNKNVLIPRPETEQLVELILQDYSSQSISVVDLGTGSGCIPIALKKEKPDWDIHAVEISKDALELAKANSNSCETEVSFYHHDFTKTWPEAISKMDVIVSNPPYVLESERDKLDEQVNAYEPGLALFTDNLEDIYKPIIIQAQERLKKQGALYLEIHEDYSELILSFFDENLWDAKSITDYAGKPRFIKAALR